MKLLGISFSPRKEGNTVKLLKVALEAAELEGAEVELYSVAGKDIKGCEGCRSCAKTSRCKIEDDMQELYEKMLEADGIIYGTPVYFYSMTSQAKAVIDRTFAFNSPERSLANKVGGVIVVAGSQGNIDALKDLYFYMVTRQLIPANFISAYPGDDPLALEKCVQATKDLGRQMVKIAALNFKYPEDIIRSHIAYGTHTR